MCPQNIFLVLVAVVLVSYVVYWYWTKNREVYLEAETISHIFEEPILKRGVFTISIYGKYKNRKVEFSHTIDNEGNLVIWWIKPNKELPKEKLFILRYPRPTTNTYLKRGKIYFKKPEQFDAHSILDELTQAAEIVEKFGTHDITGIN